MKLGTGFLARAVIVLWVVLFLKNSILSPFRNSILQDFIRQA